MGRLLSTLPKILEKNLLLGLDSDNRWHYLHCPPGVDEEVLRDRLRQFISIHLPEWLGLISAGAAIGLGLFALKEIKNTRKELLSIKTNGNEFK